MIGSGGDSDEDMGPSTAITELPPQVTLSNNYAKFLMRGFALSKFLKI